MFSHGLTMTPPPVVPAPSDRTRSGRSPEGVAAGPQPPEQRADRLDTLIAATLFLMTAHARNGHDPRLAGVVQRHLEALADHADTPGVLGAVCEQAADHWSGLARTEAAAAVGLTGSRAGRAPGRRPWLRLVGC